MKKFKVYLKDHYAGEVTAKTVTKYDDGTTSSHLDILKVFPEEHEASGQILAYFVIATPGQRDALWSSGLACNRASAMGLIAPPLSKGDAPVLHDDPIPAHHKIGDDVEIVDDPSDTQAFDDEFELDIEDEVIMTDEVETLPEEVEKPAPDPAPSPTQEKIAAVVKIAPPIMAKLKKAGIVTVADAVDMTIEDLEKIPGIGKSTSSRLFNALNKYRAKK